MVKFCGRYGLHEFKFEAELLLVEVYLAVGDGGQAMASASVTSVDPGKVMSDNIWSSLRLTLGLMGKRELYPMIEQKNLAELNRLLNYQLGWSYSGAQSSYD